MTVQVYTVALFRHQRVHTEILTQKYLGGVWSEESVTYLHLAILTGGKVERKASPNIIAWNFCSRHVYQRLKDYT